MNSALLISFFVGSGYALIARKHHLALVSGAVSSRMFFLTGVRMLLVVGTIGALFYWRGAVTISDACSIVAGYGVTTVALNWR